MAIANNVALSRITGQYVDFQGNAIAGQVKFTLDELQRNTFADQILVPSTASLTLDSNGEFQVDLPSTTETALTPSGFTYAVEESFSNGATYDISLPVINQAETRANLVTNPSFESSTFGWTPTTATLSLSTDAVFGQFALVMTSTVTAANFGITSANTITGRIPVQPNETYTLSVYAKRGSGTRNLTLRHQGFESPSDVTVINSVTQDFTLTSDWARYSLTATTVFNTYWLDIVIQASNTGAIGNTILVDGILLEKTDTLGSYFDGSVVPTGAGGEVTITSAVESGANTIFTTSAPHNLTVGSDVFITGANSGYWNTGNRTITAITPSTFTCATYAPGFILLRDISGHYATVPDSSALDIVGDIDIRCRIAMDDWTPSALMTLFSKWNATGNQRSYALDLNTNGTLSFFWTPDGSTSNSATSTVAPTVADGAVKWVRATLDVDNGASGRDIQFFTSDDGTTWTQLGTTVTQAGTTSIYAGTASVTVGSTSNGGWSNGAFYRAQILDGIAGTTAFDADFETSITTNLPTTFTESSLNAATVTVNYSGTGFRSAGVIASTYVFPGDPNTFKLSAYSMLDFGASDSFSIVAIVRQWATAPAQPYINKISQTNATARGWYLNPADMRIGDGTTRLITAYTAPTAGTLGTLVGVRNTTADNIIVYSNTTASTAVTDTTTGTLANPFTTMLGRPSFSGVYQDFELVAAAVFRRALTEGEIATLNSYFQGRVA